MSRRSCEPAPLADDLDGVFLSRLLVCAAPADGEAALPQSAVPQVHLIAHVEGRVLRGRGGGGLKTTVGQIYISPEEYEYNNLKVLNP